MYDEKLEQLIDAALADGVLTEKEKQILFKKAQTMGVDLDEFEMVLDARLVKLKKAEEEQAASSAPKSDKFGDVKKCPACGAIVQSYQGVCSECGYAFENIKSVNSAKELSDKLESINEKYNRQEAAIEGHTTDDDDKRFSIRKDKNAALAQAIKTFPIPTSKSDLFEMLIMLQTSALDVSTHREVASAYMSKYKECLKKSKLLFSKDSHFANLINEEQITQATFNKVQKKQKGNGMKPTAKFFLWLLLVMVVCIGIIAIIVATS